MNFFNNLEKKLEKVIEGNILGRFGGKIQPIEIARAVWLEITAKKTKQKGRVYAPNFYSISLSPEDYDNILEYSDDVEDEILEYVRMESRERDFKFQGPPAIQWTGNPEIKCGTPEILAAFVKTSDLPPEIRKKVETRIKIKQVKPSITVQYETFEISSDTGKQSSFSPVAEKTGEFEETLLKQLTPILTVSEGFNKGAIYQLTADEYIIGRSEDCEISIGDPAVSRKHARLTRNNGDYSIEDLGSSAGTTINGKKASPAVLKADDRIQVGFTTFTYLKLFI
jgi:hypothetical protein